MNILSVIASDCGELWSTTWHALLVCYENNLNDLEYMQFNLVIDKIKY